MDIIRVSMLGMCGVIMGFFLKGTRAEYTAFITMGIGIMILGLAVGKLEYLFQTLGNLQNSISVDQEYFLYVDKNGGDHIYRPVFSRNLQGCGASGNCGTDRALL